MFLGDPPHARVRETQSSLGEGPGRTQGPLAGGSRRTSAGICGQKEGRQTVSCDGIRGSLASQVAVPCALRQEFPKVSAASPRVDHRAALSFPEDLRHVHSLRIKGFCF